MKVLLAVFLVAIVAQTLAAPAPEPGPKPSGGVVLLSNGVVPASSVVVGPGGGIVSTHGYVPVSHSWPWATHGVYSGYPYGNVWVG